jgi:hypothetical protein
VPDRASLAKPDGSGNHPSAFFRDFPSFFRAGAAASCYPCAAFTD